MDHSVKSILSESEVRAATDLVEKEKNYYKKFSAKDSMGKLHEIIIYDDYYLKMDDQLYAFDYDKMMYLFGTETNIDGTEKVIGFSLWATSLANPDLTVHMIIAQELFAKKHYNSEYEATQISGVFFDRIKANSGYVDAWGNWQRYTWSDYFETIFGTVNQDVKRKMYLALEKRK